MIATRAASSSAAQRTPVMRSGSPGSRSPTRWRRHSAARTASPHGAMNALCLPPALEFNSRFVPNEVARFGAAIGGDAVERARELALLGGFDRLRDFGVPESDLPAGRGGGGAAGGKPGEPPGRDPRRDPGAPPRHLLRPALCRPSQ